VDHTDSSTRITPCTKGQDIQEPHLSFGTMTWLL
jgi:hypothetical protein